MDITSILFGDSPWLADVVYPSMSGICAAVAMLSLSWYYMPRRYRATLRDPHELHFYIGIVAAALTVPALVASAATGHVPTYDIASMRNLIRLSWLLVSLVLFSVVVYYVRRFVSLWCVKKKPLDSRILRWNSKTDKLVSGG